MSQGLCYNFFIESSHITSPPMVAFKNAHLNPGLESQVLLFNRVFSVFQTHPFSHPQLMGPS